MPEPRDAGTLVVDALKPPRSIARALLTNAGRIARWLAALLQARSDRPYFVIAHPSEPG